MKQTFINCRNILACAVISATMLFGATGCSTEFDDSQLWNEIEQVKSDLAALEEKVESELNTIKELLDGRITITNVATSEDGTVVLTLSNDSKLTIYPKGAGVPANLVTVIEGEDGVLYWAQYNAEGEAVAIEVEGEKVPVSEAAPQTRINDETNAIEVSFDGGKNWIVTGYDESKADSLIADIEVVYSTWQKDSEGNPVALYCILTFADGSQAKVGMNNRIILDTDKVSVAYGASAELVATAEGATDYMLIMPEGWTCDVDHDVKAGKFAIKLNAPTKADVDNAAADAEGVAKLVVVFGNGNSAIASIMVAAGDAK